MNINLKQLAAEAASYRTSSKRPTYPQSFRRKALAAMDQVDTKKLAKVLGVSLSTLTVWSHRLGKNTRSPNLPQLVELRPDSCQTTQINRLEGLSKRLIVEVSDAQDKQLRLELPYEAGILIVALGVIEEAFFASRRR